MKFLLTIVILLLCAQCQAQSSFAIPRSKVLDITDPVSGRVYPLFIKLPRSYDPQLSQTYPVIYLTDALYSFQLISGATRFPMNSGTMQEFIIVAISYDKGSKGAQSRVRDYTQRKAHDWKLMTGKAAEHATFIRETVFSYIETHYRADPAKRTFVGNSLGGLFGAYILFSQPDMFSNYIIGSPSVWFADNDILTQSVVKSELAKRVYMAVGAQESPEFGQQQDMLAGAKALAQKIEQRQSQLITLKFSVIENATHTTAFPTTVIQGLDWLYRK